MNDPDNILKIGNYRNRSGETIKASFDVNDSDSKYTGYTDSDIIVDGGIDSSDNPIAFASQQTKNKLYFSLEDCFGQNRPRSGINKAVFYNNSNKYLHTMAPYMMARPRYYVVDKNDSFKYWTSFRYEANTSALANIERGIARINANNVDEIEYLIDDASPFIVYKNPIPTNKIVIKMQTHIGTYDLGDFYNKPLQTKISDPFYDQPSDIVNRTVPVNWEIQVLVGGAWTTAKAFTSAFDENGDPYINSDGYFELSYQDSQWEVSSQTLSVSTPLFKDFNNKNSTDIKYIEGLRVVVNSMSKKNATFDLIELSPRLALDLSDITTDYSTKKVAANLGDSGIPIGQLIASTGSITIGDYDQALNKNNQDSVIAPYIKRNVQIKFYEIIKNVDENNIYIPIKTLYAEGFPDIDTKSRIAQIQLRDAFSYLESLVAPSIIINNVSFSYAVAMMLDSIGFSNYIYKKADSDIEPVISNFFVAPNTTVAQVLEDLAVSTQTAVFFDEDNNLVFMSKSYMIPGEGDRESDAADWVMRGSIDSAQPNKLPNIVETANKEEVVFNGGKIVYDIRYIQKTYREIRQAFQLNQREKQWVYKPSLLWQVSPTESLIPSNNSFASQSAYALSAVPLNTTLTSSEPQITNGSVVNNIIDLGEQISLLAKYNGYLYSGQEIIKYDAIEYVIPGIGTKWIKSADEYAEYFAQIPFGGKLFPTGRVRIFVEYNYAQDGSTPISIARHGRAQFGTKIETHIAGITASHWTQSNVGGMSMESQYLFGDKIDEIDTVTLKPNKPADYSQAKINVAKKSLRQSLVRNRLSSDYFSDAYLPNDKLKDWANNVQSSALFFSGPGDSGYQLEKPENFVSYVYTTPFPQGSGGEIPKHVGARVRITGSTNPDGSIQNPSGAYPLTVVPASSDSGSEESSNTRINSASGGISLFVDPATNNGYFFEIFALNEINIGKFGEDLDTLANMIFYKVVSDANTGGKAIPVRLWSGRSQILVDSNAFLNINRTIGSENPVVYDLAIEYREVLDSKQKESIGIEFFLYVNNQLVGTVFDKYNDNSSGVLNKKPNIGLFVRGNSRLLFEKVYALKTTENTNYINSSEAILSGGLELNKDSDDDKSFQSYTMPAAISSTYFAGLSPIAEPKYNLFIDEFGAIMRECAYFNVRYDKAYPALLAVIAKTFNKLKGYTIAGFTPSAYGAEFLIFNTSDSTIALDESTSSWLKIIGITFTQQSTQELTVEEYFNENSNLSDPAYFGGSADGNIVLNKQNYQKVKNSIAQYGKKEFTLSSPYIQNKELAENIMKWMIEKVILSPRISVGVKTFATPHLQLGDIVEFYYIDAAGKDQIAPQSKKFVIYSMDYSRSSAGLDSTIYLSEVR